MSKKNKKDIPKVTTEDIIRDVAEATGMPKQSIKDIIAATKKAVAKRIEKGEAVQLTGFFSIAPQYRASRIANNISTKKKETIPETVGVSIKAGTEIKTAAAKLDPLAWRPEEK